MYSAGKVILKEGDRIDNPFLIVDGKVMLTSTLGYRIEVNKGEIIGEWVLLEDRTLPESITAVTRTEIEPIEKVKFSFSLLDRAFLRVEEVNKSFTRDLLSFDETVRVIKKHSRGRWKFLHELLKNPYYRAREQIINGNYEKAFELLVSFDKRAADPELSVEVDIWKAFCLYFTDPKSAAVRYAALVRKSSEYRKFISFSILMTLFSKGLDGLNENTTLNLYLKHGIFIPSRTIMMVEGEEGYEAFFILSGYPRVMRFSANEERLLSFVGPAEIVGEVSTIGERPRTATVITNSSVQALRFTKSTLEDIVSSNEEFAVQLLKSALKRVKRMRILKDAGNDPYKRFGVLFKLWSPKELNNMKISLEEIESFLGVRRKEAVDILSSSKLTSIKSDGTVKFIEKE